MIHRLLLQIAMCLLFRHLSLLNQKTFGSCDDSHLIQALSKLLILFIQQVYFLPHGIHNADSLQKELPL